jgi:hypothetical protein
MEVLRLRCEQIPDVAFIGIKQGLCTTYLAHAQQFVGVLRGNSERTGSSRALNVFLNSVLGKVLKEQDGGDLLSAIQKGSLDKMLYTYRLKPSEGGAPSKLVSINGMKELLNGVPYVDATVPQKLDGLYQVFSTSNFSFMQATPEQCAKEEEEEGIVQDALDNVGFHDSNAATCVQSERLWLETRLFHYQSMTQKKIMDEKLKVKDMEKAVLKEQSDKEKARLECEHVKESAAKDIAMEKEKAEKEKALLENGYLKEKAAYEARVKELELANLRMQLEREKTRDSALGEGGRSSGGNTSRKRAQESALETEDDEGEEVEHLPRAEAENVVLPFAGGNPQIHWLVVYEGEVEVTFDQFQSKLPLLSKFCSVRFNDRWFALLSMEKRIRGNPVMKAMLAMEIAGRVWVEAFAGRKTWVGIDIPECNAHSHSGEHIVKYMEKKQRAPAQFAMVVVK